MPLWRGGPNTRTLPTVLLTPSASKAADMAHLCVPQNQALWVCRGFVPDIQICGTHGRKNLVNATIISNAEEEEDRQTDRQTDRDREKRRHRDIDRQTDRQTDRQRHRDKGREVERDTERDKNRQTDRQRQTDRERETET